MSCSGCPAIIKCFFGIPWESPAISSGMGLLYVRPDYHDTASALEGFQASFNLLARLVLGLNSCCCWCLVAQSCLTLLRSHGLWPARLLCPWDFPGRNPAVGCHYLLQGIFPTQGSNLYLLFKQHSLWYFVMSAQAD